MKKDNIRKQIFKSLLYSDNYEKLKKDVLDSLIYYRDDSVKEPYGLITPASDYKSALNTYGASYSQIIGEKYDTIVIIAPVYKMAFDGIALPSYDSYEFFNDFFFVDKDAINFLIKYNKEYININDKAHEIAYGVELQLPFLHSIFKNGVKIVPIIVGILNTKLTLLLSKALFEMQQKIKKHFFYVVSTNLNKDIDLLKAKQSCNELKNSFELFNSDYLSERLSMGQIVSDCSAGIVTLMRLGELLNKKNATVLNIANNVDNNEDASKLESYVSAIFW